MTDAPIKGSKLEQPIQQAQLRQRAKRTKPAAETKREGKDRERATGAEELLQQSRDELAGRRFFGEDDYWEQLDRDVVRVQEALGIDDDDFCRGIVRQLYQATTSETRDDKTDFNFMLSVLKDAKPVDKFDAMFAVYMVVAQVAAMRQAQNLLKPARFELPADFILACHHAGFDASRLDKQKIKIDDQQVREWAVRMFNKLTSTSIRLSETRMSYRKAQHVSAPRGGHLITHDATQAIRETASMNGAATMPAVLNGKRDH